MTTINIRLPNMNTKVGFIGLGLLVVNDGMGENYITDLFKTFERL